MVTSVRRDKVIEWTSPVTHRGTRVLPPITLSRVAETAFFPPHVTIARAPNTPQGVDLT